MKPTKLLLSGALASLMMTSAAFADSARIEPMSYDDPYMSCDALKHESAEMKKIFEHAGEGQGSGVEDEVAEAALGALASGLGDRAGGVFGGIMGRAKASAKEEAEEELDRALAARLRWHYVTGIYRGKSCHG
ncbi:hypothetical protein MNBD_ALPHA06-1148 [hydrothermal vent metagenome]|uniref:Uncharacterized protein n=1 Tax=hydrothermal vent metagenome TaxID=652676 RepID=A0A3B0RUB5_9ZZZZ